MNYYILYVFMHTGYSTCFCLMAECCKTKLCKPTYRQLHSCSSSALKLLELQEICTPHQDWQNCLWSDAVHTILTLVAIDHVQYVHIRNNVLSNCTSLPAGPCMAFMVHVCIVCVHWLWNCMVVLFIVLQWFIQEMNVAHTITDTH